MKTSKSKEKCIVCGSVRHRSQMVKLTSGHVAHVYHHGVESCAVQTVGRCVQRIAATAIVCLVVASNVFSSENIVLKPKTVDLTRAVFVMNQSAVKIVDQSKAICKPTTVLPQEVR
jgi:hypothetical protein